MASLGWTYWKQMFLVLDFFIITISLTLELVFHFKKGFGFDFETAFALLVMVRLWRFVRIGHVSSLFFVACFFFGGFGVFGFIFHTGSIGSGPSIRSFLTQTHNVSVRFVSE